MEKLRSEILNSMITDNLIEPADSYKVNKIVEEFKGLNKTEQVLFLLRASQAGGSVSCQQRVEINETVTWLKANFVQDHMVALPKEEVYGMYKDHCNGQNVDNMFQLKSEVKTKPVSTADFGKIVRQVFPDVKARRLGQRGNSRYCYANIRKKSTPDCPQLPEISSPSLPYQTVDQLTTANKILNWANKIFGQEWESLEEFEQVLHNIDISSSSSCSSVKRKRSISSAGGNNSQQGNLTNGEKSQSEGKKLPIPRLKREDSSASADEPEMQKYFCSEEKWPQLRQLLTTNKFTPIFNPPPANNNTKRRHYSTTTTMYTTNNPPISNLSISNQPIDSSNLLYMQPRSQSVPLANLFQSLSDDYYEELMSSTPDSGFGSLSSTPRNPMLSSVSSDVIRPVFMDTFGDHENSIQSQIIQSQLAASHVDTSTDFFSPDFDSESNVFESLDFDVK